jgi:hypothetical protein
MASVVGKSNLPNLTTAIRIKQTEYARRALTPAQISLQVATVFIERARD